MSLNRNLFFTLLTQLPTTLLGFVTGVLLTRLLGPQGRGVYALLQSDIELFALLLNLSFGTAVVQFVASGKIRLERIVGIGVLSIAAGTAVLAAVLGAYLGFVEQPLLLPKGYASLLYVGYLLIAHFVGLSTAQISAIFQGRANFRVVNIASLINALFNLLLFAALFAASRLELADVGIAEVFKVSIAALLCNLAVWIYFYWVEIGVTPRFDFSLRGDLRPLISFGFVIHLAYVVNLLNYRLDTWIVNYFHGPEQLGYYALAANLAQMVWLISNPLATVLYPHLVSSHSGEARDNSFAFFSRFNTTAVLSLALIVTVAAGYLVPGLYGAEFSKSVLPLRILLIGTCFTSMTKVFATMALAEGQARANLTATIIGLGLTIALDFLLIPGFGIIGASVASVISYLGVLAWVLLTLFRRVGLPFKNYYLISSADLRVVGTKIRESLFLRSSD